MAKNASVTAELESTDELVDGPLQTLRGGGRAIADQLPGAVDNARSALDTAQGQLDGLSDRGVIAAVGFTAGITAGLFLAGSPRLILALSAAPVIVTVRSALKRGVRFSRLVN